jgi:hypothetical protein
MPTDEKDTEMTPTTEDYADLEKLFPMPGSLAEAEYEMQAKEHTGRDWGRW